MSREKHIMDTTVELVSAYMNSLHCNGLCIDDDCAEQYSRFIETIYKKVEELTATE